MDIKKMREASYLLPDPGGEVVRECLDEIESLESEKKKVGEQIQFLIFRYDKIIDHFRSLGYDVGSL